MIYERLHVTIVVVIATLVDSVVVAEFAGYWLHRLLLSYRLPAGGTRRKSFCGDRYSSSPGIVAINKLGDSLANSGTTFASDNDPEFAGQAVPFSLKLIEGLLAESPKHRGLLFAAASGFTQYSYVYVQQPSEEIESADVEKSAFAAQELPMFRCCIGRPFPGERLLRSPRIIRNSSPSSLKWNP